MPLLKNLSRVFLPGFVARGLGLQSEESENQDDKPDNFFAGHYNQLIDFASSAFGSVEAGFEKHIDKVVYQSTASLPFQSAAFVDVQGGIPYPLVGEFAKLAYPIRPEEQNPDKVVEEVVKSFMETNREPLNNLKRDFADQVKSQERAVQVARVKARALRKAKTDDEASEEEDNAEEIVNASETKLLAATLYVISGLIELEKFEEAIKAWIQDQKAHPEKKRAPIDPKTKEYLILGKDLRLLLRGLADFYPENADMLKKIASALSETEVKLLVNVPGEKPEVAPPARRATI